MQAQQVFHYAQIELETKPGASGQVTPRSSLATLPGLTPAGITTGSGCWVKCHKSQLQKRQSSSMRACARSSKRRLDSAACLASLSCSRAM